MSLIVPQLMCSLASVLSHYSVQAMVPCIAEATRIGSNFVMEAVQGILVAFGRCDSVRGVFSGWIRRWGSSRRVWEFFKVAINKATSGKRLASTPHAVEPNGGLSGCSLLFFVKLSCSD